MTQEFLLSNADQFLGKQIALTDWLTINQDQVDRFGEVTRWTPWMHTDPVRCAEESPYGGTLVHGFFIVSLITYFMEGAGVRPKDGAYSLNYGMDKVRVLRPVITGSGVCLRDRIKLIGVTDRGEGKRLLKTSHEFEVEGQKGPSVYVEYLNFWFPKAQDQVANH